MNASSSWPGLSRPSTSYQSFSKDVDARHPATPRLRRAWSQSAEASAKAGTRPGMTRFNTAPLAKAPHAPAEKIRPQHQRDLPCPSPSRKIFRFRRRANQFYQLAPSFPGKRGASRSSRTRDGMRWTRQRWRAKWSRRAGFACERRTGAQTNGASTPSPKFGGQHMVRRELWWRSLRTAKSCGPGIRC